MDDFQAHPELTTNHIGRPAPLAMDDRRASSSSAGASRSCDFCQSRKVKCVAGPSPGDPCEQCSQRGRACTFSSRANRPPTAAAQIRELEETVRRLQAQLDRVVAGGLAGQGGRQQNVGAGVGLVGTSGSPQIEAANGLEEWAGMIPPAYVEIPTGEVVRGQDYWAPAGPSTAFGANAAAQSPNSGLGTANNYVPSPTLSATESLPSSANVPQQRLPTMAVDRPMPVAMGEELADKVAIDGLFNVWDKEVGPVLMMYPVGSINAETSPPHVRLACATLAARYLGDDTGIDKTLFNRVRNLLEPMVHGTIPPTTDGTRALFFLAAYMALGTSPDDVMGSHKMMRTLAGHVKDLQLMDESPFLRPGTAAGSGADPAKLLDRSQLDLDRKLFWWVKRHGASLVSATLTTSLSAFRIPLLSTNRSVWCLEQDICAATGYKSNFRDTDVYAGIPWATVEEGTKPLALRDFDNGLGTMVTNAHARDIFLKYSVRKVTDLYWETHRMNQDLGGHWILPQRVAVDTARVCENLARWCAAESEQSNGFYGCDMLLCLPKGTMAVNGPLVQEALTPGIYAASCQILYHSMCALALCPRIDTFAFLNFQNTAQTLEDFRAVVARLEAWFALATMPAPPSVANAGRGLATPSSGYAAYLNHIQVHGEPFDPTAAASAAANSCFNHVASVAQVLEDLTSVSDRLVWVRTFPVWCVLSVAMIDLCSFALLNPQLPLAAESERRLNAYSRFFADRSVTEGWPLSSLFSAAFMFFRSQAVGYKTIVAGGNPMAM